jgi:hypothetical protein
MTRLTKIALALALPVTLAGCADDTDNETNASADDTGTDTTGPDSNTASNTASNTSPTSMTDTEDTTVDTTETMDPSDDTTDTMPTGCVDGNDPASPRVELEAEIGEDTTLTCDTVWVLTQATFVRNAVLTIEPGTTIIGANGSALVVDTTARIEAAGTESAPIVFTSAQPVGSRQRADWGGLVILGSALVNLPNGVGNIEGIADPPSYGGNDPAHNCGTLQYVRVEWAGFELVMDSELNGITFYACGTETTVDHVQSHMGSDDAFEWFGGGFDAKYLIASGQADDALDVDLGFVGTFQYVLVVQDPANEDGNHGLEWSNGPDDFTAEPLTSPTIANLTYIGQGDGGNPGKSIGFNIKEGAEAAVYNSYFTNVTGFGATLQDQATLDVADGGGVTVEGTFWGIHAGFGLQGDGPYTWTEQDVADFFLDQPGNMDGVDLMLDGTLTAPNVKPAADSAAVGGGVAAGVAGIDDTTYVGAVDPEAADDWTQAPWTNYAI